MKYEKFKHGGSVGDLIASLAPLSQLGYPIEFYINRSANTGWRISEKVAKSLIKLLEIQPFIKKTGIVENPNNIFDLDRWRTPWRSGLNLSDMHSKFLDLPFIDRNKAWLISPVSKIAPVVIHRSPRYHSSKFDWRIILDRFGKDAVFVGDFNEYIAFTNQFGSISYWYTKTYLDLAMTINGCKLFIGNQSSPQWITESLKKPKILESVEKHAQHWNCEWERENCWNVYGGNFDNIPKDINE